jgi:hypothetical protein
VSRGVRSVLIRVLLAVLILAAVLTVDYASWMTTGSAPLAVPLRGGEYAGALGPGFTINESFCFGPVATCARQPRHVWVTLEPLPLLLSVALLMAVTYGATALWSLRTR